MRKQSHAEDCVRGPLPIHTYHRHNTGIARYGARYSAVQDTWAAWGPGREKPQYHGSWESVFLPGIWEGRKLPWLWRQEAHAAVCGAGTVFFALSRVLLYRRPIIGFLTSTALLIYERGASSLHEYRNLVSRHPQIRFHPKFGFWATQVGIILAVLVRI